MGGTKREVDVLREIGEPLREMASALVDGEAGEFETRRVLDASSDPSVRALLARHYTLRTVMRREADLLCPPALTRSILAAIDAESMPQGAVVAAPRWRGWVGGAAVAASVCLVTVVGLRGMVEGDATVDAPRIAAVGSTLGPLGQPAREPVAVSTGVMPVGLRPAMVDDADGVARERLQMFMLEHAGNAALNTPEGMMPYARVVSWDEP